jgi:hypothetical protein
MNLPAFTIASIIFGAVAISGLAWAKQGERGGPTPSPQGAEVHFVGLNDGAKLPTKVTIRFGLRGMGVAPAVPPPYDSPLVPSFLSGAAHLALER